MTWVSLQMISIGSLLIFNPRASFTAAGRSRCISEDQLKNRTDKFQRRYRDQPVVLRSLQTPKDARTCAQVAREMRGETNQRSLSPWTYRRDRDDDRFPPEIAVAECLCHGCIIDQQEDMSYNSVPVPAPLMVLRKARCPTDPDKYVVKKEVIQVAVGCTCVVPSYSNQ